MTGMGEGEVRIAQDNREKTASSVIIKTDGSQHIGNAIGLVGDSSGVKNPRQNKVPYMPGHTMAYPPPVRSLQRRERRPRDLCLAFVEAQKNKSAV